MTADDIKKYKDSLYTALSRDLSDFEKNFLLIAAGILTFSVTFIKDIVSISDATVLFLLFAAWLMMAVAVGLMMFTFINSAYASDDILNSIDDFITNNVIDISNIPADKEKQLKSETQLLYRKRKKDLRCLRIWAIISFLVGIILFGSFVAINLSGENKTKKEPGITIQVDNKKNTISVNGLKIELKDSAVIIKK
jgi:hypothetical protein